MPPDNHALRVVEQLRDLLPVHPGAVFTANPLAAGLEMSVAKVVRGLVVLQNQNLVVGLDGGRWRRHADTQGETPFIPSRTEDRHRFCAQYLMIEWYAERTAAVDLALDPTSPRLSGVFSRLGSNKFGSPVGALQWFEAELANVLAAHQVAVTRGADLVVIGLTEALWNPLRITRRHAELAHTQRLGADAAARQVDSLEPEFRVRQALGESGCGLHEAALATCTAVLARTLALGMRATALTARARIALRADDPHTARQDLQLALAFSEQHDNRRGMALQHRYLAEVALHPAIDEPMLAQHHLGSASVLFRAVDDQVGFARSRILLARARLRMGYDVPAVTALDGVENTLRAYGAPGYLADLATVHAEIHHALGDTARADAFLAEAATLSAASPRVAGDVDPQGPIAPPAG